MPMDPALRRFLDARSADESTDAEPLTDAERVSANRLSLLDALRARDEIIGLPNDVVTREVSLNASLRGRLYLPPSPGIPLPVLTYLHGGGWICGSVATHDPFCRLLAHAAGVSIVSVDYRLAPEHPYPAAQEDAQVAVQWVAEHAHEWGGDASRMAIGGDSAGANVVAATVNQRLAAAAPLPIIAQLLLFPVTDHPSGGHASYAERGHGFEAEFMHWVWEQYAARESPDDPGISPLRAPSLARLPPTFVASAEHDILRDEALAYVEKLRAAGVPLTHLHSPDMHHNFCVNPAVVSRFPQSRKALSIIADWLARTLTKGAAE